MLYGISLVVIDSHAYKLSFHTNVHMIIIIMEYRPARGVQDTKVITSRTYNNIKHYALETVLITSS